MKINWQNKPIVFILIWFIFILSYCSNLDITSDYEFHKTKRPKSSVKIRVLLRDIPERESLIDFAFRIHEEAKFLNKNFEVIDIKLRFRKPLVGSRYVNLAAIFYREKENND